MGGFGSGQYTRWGKRTIEDCHNIDAQQFSRNGIFLYGFVNSWVWRDRDGNVHSSITTRGWRDAVELRYRVNPNTAEEESIANRVRVESTPCHYGGERFWFWCPGKRCGRRVKKLYLSGRYFLCRHCHCLNYTSQHERPHHRLMRKAQRIRQQLGGTPNLFEPFPWKPKWMHWSTYSRLYLQEREANHASSVESLKRFPGHRKI